MERVAVELNGREIFRCNILHLLYNSLCSEDLICQRLVNTVLEMADRFYTDSNYPKFANILRGKRVLQEIITAQTVKSFSESSTKLRNHVSEQKANTSVQ